MATYPLAVWTANHGLDWAFPRGEIDVATLERCRKAFGPLPDFDSGDPGFEGVWITADRVFAVRCQSVKAWDFRGRDATYLAVTWLPRAEAASTNFEELFAVRELREPMRQVPPFFSATLGGPVPVRGPAGSLAHLVDFRGVGPMAEALLPGETATMRRPLGEKVVTLRRLSPPVDLPRGPESVPEPFPRQPQPAPMSPLTPPPAPSPFPWLLVVFTLLLVVLLVVQSWRLNQAKAHIQALEVAKHSLEKELCAQGLPPNRGADSLYPNDPFEKHQSIPQPIEQEKSNE